MEAAPRPAWHVPALCVLLAVITSAVYSPVANHPFINYDDSDYVTENQHVREGLTWQTISWAMTAPTAANWHPVTWLSHALDCQLYGLDPAGHHITSLLLHICNVLLLFLLLFRVTGALWRSVMVAALFALHPLNVESVAWIAERKNVLSMFCFLLALGAYGWYALRPNWRRYSVIAVFFALGLAAKPMVITLPCVLLLLDYWPLNRIAGWTTPSSNFPVEQRQWPRLVWEKIPLLLLSAASAVITMVVQSVGHAVRPLGDLPLSVRLENAVYSYMMYLAKTFWPARLAPMYPHPLDSLSFTQIGFSVVLLVGITALVWTERRKYPYAVVGWLWFLGTLVPVIGVIQVGAQAMADRYAYLPLIGIFVIVVWGLSDILSAHSFGRPTAIVAAAAVLPALSFMTVRQLGYWQSSMDLWTHTLEVTHDNFIADDIMGTLLLKEGRMDALNYFEDAARLMPSDPIALGALGANLHDRGKLEEAIHEYTIALRTEPHPQFRAHLQADLGVIYRQLGDYSSARENSHQALAEDPKEVQDMIQQLSQVVASHPAAQGYWRLGLLLEGADKLAEARAAYEKALSLNPDFLPARKALNAIAQ